MSGTFWGVSCETSFTYLSEGDSALWARYISSIHTIQYEKMPSVYSPNGYCGEDVEQLGKHYFRRNDVSLMGPNGVISKLIPPFFWLNISLKLELILLYCEKNFATAIYF